MQEKYTAKRLTKNTCMIRRYWEKFGKIEDIGYILYRFEVIMFYVYFISLQEECTRLALTLIPRSCF